MSGYITAKNLAQQLRRSAVVALLSKSLAEEEKADQLLNQVAHTHVGRKNAGCYRAIGGRRRMTYNSAGP